jgi:uncharacterized protein
MKDIFFLVVGIAFIIGSLYVFFSQPLPERYRNQNNGPKTVIIGNYRVIVEIVETAADRSQGLSGRESLEIGKGMLFVFENSGIYGFWMKDMNFPIDIVWIDEERLIVGISHQVEPESYPEVYYPARSVKYVLEIPAGEALSQGLSVGDVVQFSNE